MKLRKRISMIVLVALLGSLLAFSIYADEGGNATATSTYAEAETWSDTRKNMFAVARLTNLLGWTGDSLEEEEYSLHAYGYDYNLKKYETYPATSARASACVGEIEYDWDIWPDN